MKATLLFICDLWRGLNWLGLVLGALMLLAIGMGVSAPFTAGHLVAEMLDNAFWLLVTPKS